MCSGCQAGSFLDFTTLYPNAISCGIRGGRKFSARYTENASEDCTVHSREMISEFLDRLRSACFGEVI
jgi:hypothetical protein